MKNTLYTIAASDIMTIASSVTMVNLLTLLKIMLQTNYSGLHLIERHHHISWFNQMKKI